ncbi:MAG: hypothetical protein KAR56_03190, partial [Thermoplasmata archaeon]|nr:hypothetical protein [Thermoplasmata archaeon]
QYYDALPDPFSYKAVLSSVAALIFCLICVIATETATEYDDVGFGYIAAVLSITAFVFSIKALVNMAPPSAFFGAIFSMIISFIALTLSLWLYYGSLTGGV